MPLLKNVFRWARECEPTQPLTAGVFAWEECDLLCLELSDVVSYHDYLDIEKTKERVTSLQALNRPLLCTEWLHRQNHNSVETHLPFYADQNIAVFNWGFVQGKTQTNLSWEKELNCHNGQPELWQHDLLHTDGTPYRQEELELFRTYGQRAKESCK